MELRAAYNVITGSNASVIMKSGDHLSVAYESPDGKWNIFNISAQDLTLVLNHEQSKTSIVVRPGSITVID